MTTPRLKRIKNFNMRGKDDKNISSITTVKRHKLYTWFATNQVSAHAKAGNKRITKTKRGTNIVLRHFLSVPRQARQQMELVSWIWVSLSFPCETRINQILTVTGINF